jgi:hypothetical protein
MLPPQLEGDINSLKERGYEIQVVEDGTRFYVILKAFRFPDGGKYTPPVTDLMLMADYQYPMSRLDMYWTDPVVYLTAGGLPRTADQFEQYAGRRWQRWSWHYDGWNPSKHNLSTHIEVFLDRLARGT